MNETRSKAEIPRPVIHLDKSHYSSSGSFRIESTILVNRRVDLLEVFRAIEYLGGIPTGSEFAFSSARRRDEALTILCEKYGTGYFASVENEAKEGQVKENSP